MSLYFRSFVKIISYLINPKSTSLSSTSSKPRPPTIQLDSILELWGLIPGQYMNDGSIKSTKFGKFYQILIMSFLGYYTFKVFLTMFIDDDSILLIYLGDTTVIYISICPRIYVHALNFSISLKAFLISIYYFINRNTGKLSWLKISQLTKGLFKNLFINFEYKIKLI